MRPRSGNTVEFGDEIWRQKTRIMGLPVGEEIVTLAFLVLTQYRLVTERRADGQTDGRTRCDRYYPRYHSVARAKSNDINFQSLVVAVELN